MKTDQVFVSHTSDMGRFPHARSFVQAALDAVSRAGMAPVDMRYFAARDGQPADYCRQRVRECEIYVAVVGFRYGSLVPGRQISYTELEFEAAGEAGLPRLAFLLDEAARPGTLTGADAASAERFRNRLRDAQLLVRTFTSPDGLELEIFHALSELSRGAETSTLGKVPSIWNVPNRNTDFTGREGILLGLHNDLAGDGRAVVLARALYGLGGVGKTQVALEYAHRFKADYDLVWWVPAERPQEITLALAELAARMGLQTTDNASEAAELALEELRRDRSPAGHWLLIFDNAEDPAELAPFLPAGSGHVVITSRNHAWTRQADPVELDVFSRDESITHLTGHVPGLARDDADKLSAAVGDLPLAIEQAGAWLAETGMPATLYLEWLSAEAASALSLNTPFGYALPVAATWNMSLNRLQERSPAAVRLLQILAFCSPGPIAMTLLYGAKAAEILLPLDEELRNRYMLSQVIRDISSLALIRIDQGSQSLQIHRLVQVVIRAQMPAVEQRRAKHEVHLILADARPAQGDLDNPADWSAYDLIWSHLEPSHADECADPGTRQLLLDWVRYQWKVGEFESGLNLGQRLKQIWARDPGPDHEQTLHLQFQMANILRSMGRYHEACDLDTSVLDRQRAVLGAGHLHTLRTANGQAADFRALGRFQAALESDRMIYGTFRKEFGADHLRTLAAAHNLGNSLRLIGQCFAARRIDQDTLDRQRVVLGRDHPHTLLSAASLAHDMRDTGDLHGSIDLLRPTCDQYRAVLGEDMEESLCAVKNLAVSLRRAGQFSAALALTQRAHDRYILRYNPRSLDALSCALNLACDYAALGDKPRACELTKEVGDAYRSSMGEDHPFTLAAASNLVSHLRATGRLTAARDLARQALDRLHARLGGQHPFSLCCALNLANCLGDGGDFTTAAALQRETAATLRRNLGPAHPDTLACEANLLVTLHRAGQLTEAGQARTRILDRLDTALGAHHPDSVLLRNWQYIDRDLEAGPT